MEKKNIEQLDDDLDRFFKQFGNFIKQMREIAGYPTPEAFANTINMSRSQYSAYESGKNMKLSTARQILLELGVPTENWLNISFFEEKQNYDHHKKELHNKRMSQVMSQVKSIEKSEEPINPRVIQRYIDVLINCIVPKSRKYITSEILKLEDSYNSFQRNAGKLIEYGWLSYTDKDNKNNPSQSYYTTESGKRVLRMGDGK